jgi:hypothetical protein
MIPWSFHTQLVRLTVARQTQRMFADIQRDALIIGEDRSLHRYPRPQS